MTTLRLRRVPGRRTGRAGLRPRRARCDDRSPWRSPDGAARPVRGWRHARPPVHAARVPRRDAIALPAGLVGYFVVLRGQVFTGDALSHVAFTGALAALAVGVDLRLGLFAADHRRRRACSACSAAAAGPTTSSSAACSPGSSASACSSCPSTPPRRSRGNSTAGINVLFGSIFGLGPSTRAVAAAIARRAHRRCCWRSPGRCCSPASTQRRPPPAGSRYRLGVVFLALVGATAAEATQAVGALLLLGLLAAPAGAAYRWTRSPFAGMALSAALAVTSMVVGLTYELPRADAPAEHDDRRRVGAHPCRVLPDSSAAVGTTVGPTSWTDRWCPRPADRRPSAVAGASTSNARGRTSEAGGASRAGDTPQRGQETEVSRRSSSAGPSGASWSPITLAHPARVVAAVTSPSQRRRPPHAPPLYDGLGFPDEPYRWVLPPQGNTAPIPSRRPKPPSGCPSAAGSARPVRRKAVSRDRRSPSQPLRCLRRPAGSVVGRRARSSTGRARRPAGPRQGGQQPLRVHRPQ